MANASTECDVIVIGGGLSGLSAAYHVKKRDPSLDVIVLEAKPRVGGRTLTVDMEIAGGKKAKFDLGGQWVGPLQSDLLELMNELGMAELIYSQYTTGNKVCRIGHKHVVKYNTKLPFYNPLIHLEVFFLMRKIDKFADQLDIDNPFLRNPHLAEYLDSITVETFIRENVYNSVLRELIRVALRSVFGMEGSQMSALYLFICGKSSGRLRNVFTVTNDGCKRWRIMGGAQQISERLAAFIGPSKVLLRSPVTGISQTENSVSITAFVGGKTTTFQARRAISAIPPNQLWTVKINPPLPNSRKELLRAMPMGNIYKFMITYPTAFWRDAKLSGETCSLADDCDATNIACVSFDACLVDGTPALVGLMGGHQNVYWRQRTPADRRKAILGTIAKMLGDEALKPIDFREKDWGLEQWSGGCPVSVMQTGVGRFFVSTLRQPLGHLYLAGTESAQRSCGFLSGAVQAGRRAATEVLYSLGKHSHLDDAILLTTCFRPEAKPTSNKNSTKSIVRKSIPVFTVFALMGGTIWIFRRHLFTQCDPFFNFFARFH